MKGLVTFAAFCFAGTLIGLITAQQAVGGRYGVVAQPKGPWTAWPAAALPKLDPYTRAHHLSFGLLPSNRFDSLDFEARIDEAGQTLDGNCTYVVSGPMPRARWWSFTVVGADGQQLTDGESRHGLISQQLIYEPDGTFRIHVSSEPQAGNWIRTPADGQPFLLIRLYSPDAALRRNPLAAELPAIERQVCR